MKDDRMDDLIIRAARDYNAPGAVPREAMWARIEAARRAAHSDAPDVGRSRSRSHQWMWPGMAAAAALLLYAGITIGRRLEHEAAGHGKPPVVAVAPTPVSPTPLAPEHDSASVPDVVRQLHEATRETQRTAERIASTSTTRGGGSRKHGSGSAASPDLTYRLVLLRHLAGSEAMITAFQASARRGEGDAEIASWARDLLGTTRLLESSPSAADPTMRRLLEDLDLVIAQIVQYTSTGSENPEELKLIEQSIRQRGVMSKLRGTIPGRVLAAGT